jgi:tetratricopeptide (TPR) repeat protein/predicted aspartyl protease
MAGRFRSLIFGAVVAAAWLAASAADAKCRLSKYFDLPVDMEGRAAVITTRINGQEARFVVDTGALFSMLTPEAASRLKTRPVPVSGLLMVQGIGGIENASAAEAKEFNFAGVPLKNVQFIVVGREFAPGAVGLLGENILSFADEEYDFAHGVMRFLKTEDCKGVGLAYWAGRNYSEIPLSPFDPPRSWDIKGTVKINGHPVRVLFDTGAGASMLTRRAAERVGVKMDGPDVRPAGLTSGIGRRVVETWTAPIESFAIGDEEITNTLLTIGKADLDDVDMILGMDFFLSHRVLVSRSQNKLYFSYNGGPVFRLDTAPAPASGKSIAAPDPAAEAPRDADGWARQGAALMSRHDYAGAVKAFDKAIELDPKSPKRYVDRARAHWTTDRTLAMSDLDQALKLKPDFTPALMDRGDLFLNAKDYARAEADFAAAVKASPRDGDIEARIAGLYDRHDLWAQAIPHYDAWISAHSKNDRLWVALNERCWARAMLGKDLDKALDDCNAALKAGPRNSEVLDSRGLVYLRLGRYREAIADYDAALKLQPKEAWSLYGRGLAKQRLGMKAEGEADVAAALALSPGLEVRAKAIGLIEAAPTKAGAKP